MATLYRYAFDKRLIALWGAFGVRPAKDGVTVTDEDALRATFGLFKLETPLTNIAGAHITRDYRWWTAVGARRSFKDDGLTFGTNANGGVCIHFHEKVPSPLRPKGHSALTVTVEDLEGLANALTHP
jgi:pyocin large subunit-like protein